MSINNKQAEECCRRMEVLGIKQNLISDFLNKGEIYMSVCHNVIIDAVIQKPSGDILECIKEFEERYKARVYHVQACDTAVGKLLTFLYVSSHEEEWSSDLTQEIDREGREYFYTYAYVKNLTWPEYSEIGGVGILPSKMGGVSRIY